jgi:hypothetical protein
MFVVFRLPGRIVPILTRATRHSVAIADLFSWVSTIEKSLNYHNEHTRAPGFERLLYFLGGISRRLPNGNGTGISDLDFLSRALYPSLSRHAIQFLRSDRQRLRRGHPEPLLHRVGSMF